MKTLELSSEEQEMNASNLPRRKAVDEPVEKQEIKVTQLTYNHWKQLTC